MSTLLPDLRTRLQAMGITTTIELGRMTDTPDLQLALTEYGAEPSRDNDGRELPALERFAVQIQGRSASAVGAAMDATRAAARAIVGKHLTISGRRYDWIRQQQEPFHAGFDENDRPLCVCNLSIQRWGNLAARTGDLPPPIPDPEPDPDPEPPPEEP